MLDSLEFELQAGVSCPTECQETSLVSLQEQYPLIITEESF